MKIAQREEASRIHAVVDLSFGMLALLVLAAFLAGTVDAIAGGGGVITVPALGVAGLSPHALLGTNKGQSVFGALASLVSFYRADKIHAQRALWSFPSGFVGALIGTRLVLHVPQNWLRPVVLVLLVAVALFLALRRPPPKLVNASLTTPVVANATLRVVGIAFLIGAYDGFFGPGTGTFLITAFVLFLKLDLSRATAEAKVVNFASNLAAVCLFAWQGKIVWAIALPMAAAQLVGGVVGARLALKGGENLVRKVVLGVVLVLSVKLAYDVIRIGF